MNQFNQLGLAAPILKALETEGYTTPTPIQAQAIPHVMEGRDLLGLAQTGTGKTAAFALPILHRLASDRKRPPAGGCRVLVLSPTRELASQIADSFRTYGRHLGLSVAVVFGGVGYGAQIQALARGLDVLVATPGRLLDHLQTRKARLDQVETLVLDEADQMLDMGFIQPIRRILPHLPKQRQTLFFSATMPREIDSLASELLSNPARVAVTPVASTGERVTQRVFLVDAGDKRDLLAKVLREEGGGRTLVFTRTKRGADKVAEHLGKAGIPAAAIHGNKSQGQRERTLAEFRNGRTKVLVATDIAARGIDVDDVTHVVNFELPNVPESYVHRIGRTARAGASGQAISFCDHSERAYLRDIERLIRKSLPVEDRRQARNGARTEPVQPAPRPERPRHHEPRRQGPARGPAGRSPAAASEQGLGGVAFLHNGPRSQKPKQKSQGQGQRNRQRQDGQRRVAGAGR